MSNQKPNHICKNVNCKNGVDGKSKEYWACDDCSKYHSYREVACSPECYKEYIEQVLIARSEVVLNNESIEENLAIDDVTTNINDGRTNISENNEL